MANSKENKRVNATFVVQIQHRQNATWQGTVVWADRNETKPFRSALELIKLIDGALEADELPEGIHVLKDTAQQP